MRMARPLLTEWTTQKDMCVATSKSSRGEPTVSKPTAPPKNTARSPLTWGDTDEIFELEADLEKQAIRFARKRGWYTRKYKSAGRRAAPDRIFIRDGSVLFVEFKRLGNAPTEQQYEEIKQLKEAGADVIWLDSIEDFRACLLQRE